METGFSDWKAKFLYWKEDFLVGNSIFRLKIGNSDWKCDFEIGNEIFRLEAEFLHWKSGF